MNGMPQQLTLGITLGSDLDFDHFVEARNSAAVQAVRESVHGEHFVYLWSEHAAGRTHLLHAACRLASENGRRSGLLSLREHAHLQPAMLEGWESLDLVAIDNVDSLPAGEWQRAVFHLYNELRDAGASLLVTATRPPASLDIALRDLKSRFGAMLVFQLHALDDNGRLEALRRKAAARGMDLPEETGRYLLTRVSRDMRDLAALLERLDRVSLARQRKLTVPFVREQLDAGI